VREQQAAIICIAIFEFANRAKRFDFSFASSKIFLLEIDFTDFDRKNVDPLLLKASTLPS